MVDFTEEHLTMITETAAKVEILEEHRAECDRLHEQSIEHRKRSDDAINNNTESNLLLAKTITEMNITLTRVVGRLDDGQPVIKFWQDVWVAWSFNKRLWSILVGLAVGVTAIVAAFKVF